MILILASAGAEAVARAIAGALSQEYNLPSAPEVVAAAAAWNRSAEWDDLLLVIYNSASLHDSTAQYIQAFCAAHSTGGTVIPVGANPAFRVPPNPLSPIKAAQYDGGPESTAAIVKAVGVFLGLALRPGSQKIFVSYRASDGKPVANSLYQRLKDAGFDAWLDEAEENLVIGDAVQDKIRSSLEAAAMVLLVDTPDAPDSAWVKIEVDLANGQLVPVLPVVAGGEPLSRFIQLQGLRRWVLVKQSGLDDKALSNAEWECVCGQIDELLLSTFRRRLKILSRTRAAFEANGYTWQPVDERLRMYRADKTTAWLTKVITMSHCLVQDITYKPALQAYWTYLKDVYPDRALLNQRLCIYDRDKVLSPAEMETLSENIPQMNAILAHYNELELLLASNFSVLRK